MSVCAPTHTTGDRAPSAGDPLALALTSHQRGVRTSDLLDDFYGCTTARCCALRPERGARCRTSNVLTYGTSYMSMNGFPRHGSVEPYPLPSWSALPLSRDPDAETRDRGTALPLPMPSCLTQTVNAVPRRPLS